MTIIKNLILRNKLRDELIKVEQTLQSRGYYAKKQKLATLAYYPDEYAILYKQINDEFSEILFKKHQLEQQIASMSGKNMFKKNTDNYTK